MSDRCYRCGRKLGSRSREILKRLTCRHDWLFVRNVYGDEIIRVGYRRSVWQCSKCGKLRYRNELHREGDSK